MTKEEAVRLFGTQRNLARALKISEPAVSRWTETVPPLRAYQIKEMLAARAIVQEARSNAGK